ncbi:L,D-transpeptidase family protein [Tsuneonella sp. SYSU-LHT278]|uniref:L,D-transpeptidase family protein n=1 Tax=Tsuneonella sediminis TaxID=3416089 RepID=UPI003F7AA099
MESMLKWAVGGVLAVLLGLGGAALATGAASHGRDRASAPALSAPAARGEAMPSAAGKPDEAAISPGGNPFTVKRILPIDGPIKYGEWHWDDEGVPDGPIVMTVDLDARVLSIFKGGYEIGAAAVLIGTDEYPTPLGTFPILYKQRHNVSEKYDNAPMPWSMFLTRDGVAIHGGSVVENGYASHGCIAGPDEFVSRIFAIAKPGDRVVITRGEMIGMGDKII